MRTTIKVAYNTSVQVFGRLFTGLITYLVTLILVRQYGSVGFGEFVKILTYISYFYIMADFGANAVTLRKITADEKETNVFMSNLLGFRIVFSLILVFVSTSLLVFLPQGTDQGFTSVARLGIILGSLTILTQSLLTTTNVYFQKTMRYDKSVIAASLGYLLTLLLAFGFARLNVSVALLSLPYVMGGAFSVLVAFLFLGQGILPAFNIKYWRIIFFESLPLGITLVLNLVYFKADSFILTLTRSTQEVGVYGLAYKFFEICLVLPTFFMNSLYPIFLERKNNGLENILRKSGLFLLFSSLILTLAVFITAPAIINFTAGTKQVDFEGAIIALRILSLSLPFFFISSFLMWLLITHEKQNLLVPFYGLSMILNVVLNAIFIPTHGYLAAAITTGITEVFVTLLLLIPSRKYL